MAADTGRRGWARAAAAVAITLTSAAAAAQPGELIERTVAIVGGEVITLSDVQTALALRLIDQPDGADDIGAAASRLIERLLVLREVDRYAPPPPPDEDIAERLDRIRAAFATSEQFARALDAGGFSEARLRAWIRDDLRIAAYLAQRFAATGTPADEDVVAYYAAHRAEFDGRGLAFDAAAPIIRDRLAAERRRELIADWIAGLRRRTPIVELWPGVESGAAGAP